MNVKMLKAAFAGLILSVCGLANAGLISVNDWHGTNDIFGGLKVSAFSDNVFLAVSKTGIFSKSDEYEMLDGYRLLSSTEYQNIINDYLVLSRGALPAGISQYPYYNEGGWAGYMFEGVFRRYFTYTDTNINGFVHHAGQGCQTCAVWSNVNDFRDSSSTRLVNSWAGFIIIKNDTVNASVPEPSTLAIFALGIMGLASRRFKKK